MVFTTSGGLFNVPLTAVVTSGVGARDVGAASGLMNMTKQVGGALGLAAFVGVGRSAAGLDFAAVFLTGAGILLAAALVALALPDVEDRCARTAR